MKVFLVFVSFFFFSIQTQTVEGNTKSATEKKIVYSTKKVDIPGYPGAFNPSITKYDNRILLTFRYVPNRFSEPWVSHIGVVELNESFETISKPVLLDTRFDYKNTPSQSEDARIFIFDNKIFLLFNDNRDITFPSSKDRRDMYVAELICAGEDFILSEPIKLINFEKYNEVLWQKNWSPFEWEGKLMMTYSINPHEVLQPNLSSGSCLKQSKTSNSNSLPWTLGPIRGGTPAQMYKGEYLAFFHSQTMTSTPASNNVNLWHYFMGAYTFSPNPPFEITSISSSPIDYPGFYTYSNYNKRVIYPGGFILNSSNAYVAFGKDDAEIWIAAIDLDELKKSMKAVQNNN